MTKAMLVGASALTLGWALPGWSQIAPDGPKTTSAAKPDATTPENRVGDVVVTAQRQSERLQDVPIALSVFTAEAIDRQQIVNPLVLQQSLPNVSFTKTNFTTSSFTIRGIGDLCTGATCDSATAVHVDDMPLLATRLFETEFLDLDRIEVLRGPQGTLFGRNATSGVINLITAKPTLDGLHATGEAEYGNYRSIRVKGMLDLPLSSTIGVRLAGLYLNRDGFTRNLASGDRIDGRNLYALRGTLSWVPDSATRVDLIGYYFREKDDRSRIQKQLCHRDPTGILGCLPDRLNPTDIANSNAFLTSILTSRETFTLRSPALAPFALGSVYGPDAFAGQSNPADTRTVDLDYAPQYFTEEEQYIAKVFHDFGPVALNVTGGYARSVVDSTTDYTLSTENPRTNNPGLLALDAYGRPGSLAPFLDGVRQTLIPNGANGGLCQSLPDPANSGVYGGHRLGCYPTSLDLDRSRIANTQWSLEAHLDSHLDGPFNFLAGAIYTRDTTRHNDYFVTSFDFDYASGIFGAGASAGIPVVNGAAYLGPPFYRNDTDTFRLTSYGVFGESYVTFSDAVKLTLGLRYNDDRKFVKARGLTLDVLTPYGSDSLNQGLNYGAIDFDPTVPGIQEYTYDRVHFRRVTGRAVLDVKLSPENLLYASYARGYKSGGINPPLPPEFNIGKTFAPEQIDALEIGSKNSFLGGTLRLNLTGFYYRYKGLQLSRIVNRTSVNDNVDADIYGAEAEAVIAPIPAFTISANLSYLHSRVTSAKYLIDPRDPSGGRNDVVVIKDLTNASNCVVAATAGGAAQANGFVAAVNQGIGASVGSPGLLHAPVLIPTLGGATGAFSVCVQLRAAAANPLSGVEVLDGVAVNLRGNRLPQAPMYKFAVGAEYAINLWTRGLTLVPRVDLNVTGNSTASIFNTVPDRLAGYEVINAQVQLSGRNERWYVRAFVQNLTDNDAVTGQYVSDPATGLFTNVFTLEPRRFGLAAGFRL